MKTSMNLTTLTTGLMASLLLAGSALAMDSAAIEERMAKISEQTATSEASRVEALETQVKELEALIQMMLDEEDSDS
jgi:outer membrane murein-binding lipoprotein Lpp|tara:strand:- start:22598 stop:22828 length:231 start_codon:yes stop_codon:yes gene_type:complete